MILGQEGFSVMYAANKTGFQYSHILYETYISNHAFTHMHPQ